MWSHLKMMYPLKWHLSAMAPLTMVAQVAANAHYGFEYNVKKKERESFI